MNVIGIDNNVSSLRDLEVGSMRILRRLKPTVNKVSSLRDFLPLKRYRRKLFISHS